MVEPANPRRLRVLDGKQLKCQTWQIAGQAGKALIFSDLS
jgi:hypothetical protein